MDLWCSPWYSPILQSFQLLSEVQSPMKPWLQSHSQLLHVVRNNSNNFFSKSFQNWHFCYFPKIWNLKHLARHCLLFKWKGTIDFGKIGKDLGQNKHKGENELHKMGKPCLLFEGFTLQNHLFRETGLASLVSKNIFVLSIFLIRIAYLLVLTLLWSTLSKAILYSSWHWKTK